jgi:hypothetical protein
VTAHKSSSASATSWRHARSGWRQGRSWRRAARYVAAGPKGAADRRHGRRAP